MLSKFNFNRQYLLIAGTILLLIIAYQLAFKRTIESWHLHSELQKKLDNAGALSYQPGYLERKNHNLDQLLLLYRVDTANFRSNVLGNITAIAESENIELAEVPLEDPSFHNTGYNLERIRFQGDFFNLEKVLKKLQSTPGIGVIRSVSIKQVNKEQTAKDQSKINMDVYFEIAAN